MKRQYGVVGSVLDEEWGEESSNSPMGHEASGRSLWDDFEEPLCR